MTDATIEALIAKQQIYDVLCNYCRALDRMNKELAYAVWHEDGTALYHDMYEGTGRGFVDWVWQAHDAMERHSHQLANSLIDVTGHTASSETYVTVTLWTLPNEQGEQQEIIGKGRYLDRWSKRTGKWAIDHREHVLDLQSVCDLKRGFVSLESKRNRTDPSFEFLSNDTLGIQ